VMSVILSKNNCFMIGGSGFTNQFNQYDQNMFRK